jgi:hypothetical protein
MTYEGLSKILDNISLNNGYSEEALNLSTRLLLTLQEYGAVLRYLKGAQVANDSVVLQDLAIKLRQYPQHEVAEIPKELK